jgi:hypothetical protein
MLRGVSTQMARATSRGMRAAYVANTEHWLTIQAVLASPRPSSPMTFTYVGRSNSGQPSDRGRSR